MIPQTQIPEPQSPEFATWIPGRRPAWKFHTEQRLARSAISINHYRTGYARTGNIYQKINGEWKIVLEVKPGTKKEELPWKREG